MSLVGQQLGEFEILEELGKGGMGAVYRARQTSLRRIVALKTLQSSLAGDAGYIARFEQEAVAAAGLNHPNLVQVYSAGENAGLHWFAMEYVEGESARVRLKRKGHLDPLEAVAIGIHVATALDYGWRKAALIHRDIKPDNIFLSGDGEVKLGDLGLAKSAGQAQDLTTTGDSMGTPLYMSPEQAEAIKTVDLRADIYSLGCTLFHLLTGHPPYVANSSVAVLLKHLSAPVPDMADLWPECPVELAAVIGKMMQKQPADRPQNYEEVIADLRHAYAAFSDTSEPSGVATPRKPVAIRQPVAVRKKRPVPAAWIVGAVTACVAALALLYFAPWKRGGHHPQAGPREKQPAAQKIAPGTAQTAENPPTALGSSKTLAVSTTPQPEAAPAPTTPAPIPQAAAPTTPAPSTPAPSTVAPSTTPKPPTEVEKWFAQVDGPQQETFQKQVQKPFDAGLADLRARYLAALDAAITKASAAGQLAEALVWRNEQQAFEKAQTVAEDDTDTPPAVKTLRAAFHQQFNKLDQDRAAQAAALLAKYDAILAKYQTLLTQHQRLDDALLLKTKRDEISLAWLGSSTPLPVVAVAHPETAQSASPLLASKEAPFINSLGMELVPVPITGGPTNGKRVLFSAWDTRVQDYEVFATETKREWPKPEAGQGPTHPAVNLTWDDAKAFCAWLTDKEHASGRIGRRDEYRLPSDHEWSCAVGIGSREKAEATPESKNGKIQVYPWGSQWPPPKGSGNYNPSLKVDEFERTSPVGSFAANQQGLYDMGGNVWQWCEDWSDKERKDRVLRGASWPDAYRYLLLSSTRNHNPPDFRLPNNGFRCVLVISGGNDPKPPQAPSSPQSIFKEATTPLASATKESPFVNSLGMKFAPVPITGGPTDGQRALFSVWKTRVQDYEAFAQETNRDWPKPDFLQGPTHPAVNVSWEDAQLFCQWLTRREHGVGQLPVDWAYRLPSDHEWSCAVGIGARERAEMLPIEKNGKISDAFPWGFQWPPPKEAGNYAELLQVDKFKYTSPVGSFSANRFGLRDLGGNAWEWCEDLYDKDQKKRVLRGAAWDCYGRDTLLSSHRNNLTPDGRFGAHGFRCVLAAEKR